MSSISIEELEERIAKLEKVVFGSPKATKQKNNTNNLPNWEINPRAYVAQYAKGKSGTKKFVLLLAFLAKGDESNVIDLGQVQTLWSRMTAASLLGMKFNRKYTSEAKTNGWVDSPKTGHYQLSFGWQEVLDSQTED